MSNTWTCVALASLSGFACLTTNQTTTAPPDPPPKTILLAFDGVDHGLVSRYLAEGALPHLASLAKRGSFHRMDTSNPVQSPASWAVFNTGTNPGRTGVPGFVSRFFMRGEDGEPRGSPLPQPMLGFRTTLAMEHESGLDRVPYEINPMQGTNWWSFLDEVGIRLRGIQIASTYPPDDEGEHTRLLSGLGLKDIGGSPGSWFQFTSDPWSWSHSTDTAGSIIKVNFDEEDGRVALTAIPGPYNWVLWRLADRQLATAREAVERTAPDDPDIGRLQEQLAAAEKERQKAWRKEVEVPIALRADLATGRVTFAFQDQGFTAGVGEWTELIPVEFPFTKSYSEFGAVRFHVIQCDEGAVRIHGQPVNVDPLRPPTRLPISSPPGFAAELAAGLDERFETLGWAMPTNPLKDQHDSHFGAQSFLSAVDLIQSGRERMLHWNLDRAATWDVYYQVFTAPDRVSHMLYRESDPDHPAHDPTEAAEQVDAWDRSFPVSRAIEESYRAMDRIVGRVIERIDAGEFGEDALLLVASDHGFSSYRYGINLNTLLHDLGFLSIKDDSSIEEIVSSGRSDLLAYVDWSRTSAYSMGLGKIFLNKAGREPNGILSEAEAIEVARTLRAQLLRYTDPTTEARVFTSVSHRDELFSGPWVGESDDLQRKVAGGLTEPQAWDGFADLFVGFAPGYRVSWTSTLGGIGPGVVVVNEKRWSGGHVSVDPSHVPGVLFTNRKAPPSMQPSLLDVGPTVVARYGIDVAATGMEGRALPLGGDDGDR